ncbi:hypothetical protein SE17_17115 [Kouleothrix aurantiaca]|uniref:HTH iclR-type domain-containing protein n=1 Tax=Kouleothrix aurantiaca TaxID=186479 RepID=A0A0P9D9I0_9CHLR|nr:hypothetical protein SE17_17115 [Kouleothrix aurantiaca]
MAEYPLARILITGRFSSEAIASVVALVRSLGGAAQVNPEVTPSQQKVLNHLHQAGKALSSIEIAAQTGLARGSVRPWLSALVKAGLVERKPGDTFQAICAEICTPETH